MNQRGWSLSSYIGYAVVLIIFVLVIAFNVIRLSRIGVVDINQETIEPIMIGENRVSGYSDAEKAVVDSLKKYGEEKYKNEKIDDTVIVSIRSLIDGGYLGQLSIGNDKCSGYGKISKGLFSNNYESYIKCGSYITPGYSSELDK